MGRLTYRLIDWPIVGANKVCISQNEVLLCQSQKYFMDFIDFMGFMDFTAFLGVIAGSEKPENPILQKLSLRAYPLFGRVILENALHIYPRALRQGGVHNRHLNYNIHKGIYEGL